jgi:hypothetical protein
VGHSVLGSMGSSVRDSVWDFVRDSVWDFVRGSVWGSVGGSVWGSVYAYVGSFFRLPKWKYAEHRRGVYPFQSCVDLWAMGLVPSFDGSKWRLHGGAKAQVLFETSDEELKARP